ncbi:hypothetical protein J7E73_13570 [Paenibacillus albidus]|uniref:hypothetical protein n=1 Tax=Paenibacillus albidus TaxID=2041023 RepID=UPI001BE53E99|nr:hypothetical protein [Paenibacillus albidus]MBT2290152.1 hypothetical protein [Paenibacillus albidus]
MIQWVVLFAMGVIFWLITLVFFRYLGPYVLLKLDEPYFNSFLLLLLTVMLLILAGVSLLVRLRMYRARGSATRFGYWTAMIGLVLDGFVLWHRKLIFPNFSEEQHQAFAVCITFASALTLLVPMLVDRIIRKPKPVTSSRLGNKKTGNNGTTVPAGHSPAREAPGAPQRSPAAEPSVLPSSSTVADRKLIDKDTPPV